jgi:hypothetical protein
MLVGMLLAGSLDRVRDRKTFSSAFDGEEDRRTAKPAKAAIGIVSFIIIFSWESVIAQPLNRKEMDFRFGPSFCQGCNLQHIVQ